MQARINEFDAETVERQKEFETKRQAFFEEYPALEKSELTSLEDKLAQTKHELTQEIAVLTDKEKEVASLQNNRKHWSKKRTSTLKAD